MREVSRYNVMIIKSLEYTEIKNIDSLQPMNYYETTNMKATLSVDISYVPYIRYSKNRG